MWRVDKPTITAEDAFETCISRIRDAGLKQRMEEITAFVALSATAYDTAAEEGQLHTVAVHTGVNGSVTTREMTRLYDGRMAAAKSPGRGIYDALIASAEHGRCPFCGHRVVSTLDHVLPKAHYPALAVAPHNLVPSCADCNKTKHDQPLADEAEQYIHPYYDEIEGELWLRAEVLETAPASVRFFVQPFEGWPVILSQRVENHFMRLGLSKLYSSQAAQELVSIRYQVTALHDRLGSDGVQLFLADSHASRSNARINSWQTAFYSALSESDWYCNGGFA
jgi:HNH endonuclease